MVERASFILYNKVIVFGFYVVLNPIFFSFFGENEMEIYYKRSISVRVNKNSVQKSIDKPHIIFCETRSRNSATQKLGVLILLINGFNLNFCMKNHVISHQLGGQLTRSNMSRT